MREIAPSPAGAVARRRLLGQTGDCVPCQHLVGLVEGAELGAVWGMGRVALMRGWAERWDDVSRVPGRRLRPGWTGTKNSSWLRCGKWMESIMGGVVW